jgi:hypothetical protein
MPRQAKAYCIQWCRDRHSMPGGSGAQMPKRMNRTDLYALVWSTPLTALAPGFGITDVGLKNSCRKFDIPVPPRGYWARLRAGKPAAKVALPAGAAGMEGRSCRWWPQSPLVLSIYRRGDPGPLSEPVEPFEVLVDGSVARVGR